MAIDWSLFAFPKTKTPIVVARATKQRKDKADWKKTKKAVDTRQKTTDGDGDEAVRCFVTGKRLQVSNTLDEWTFRDPAHIEARSKSKARRNESDNVLAVCRAVHRLIDSSSLLLLDARGREAKSVKAIDHVAWNRRMVPKKSEPCRIRKGLPVVELDKVKD